MALKVEQIFERGCGPLRRARRKRVFQSHVVQVKDNLLTEEGTVVTGLSYRGPSRQFQFKYNGPPWILLAVVALLTLVLLGLLP